MAEFDVRKDGDKEITEIRFADDQSSISSWISKIYEEGVAILSCEADEYDVAQHIKDAEHAQNLIKALNKAIELGWLK